MSDNTFPLSAESRALIERLAREHAEAKNLLEMAILSTKAAMGVPMEYGIKSLDVGFEEVSNGGNNRPSDS